MRPNDSHFQEFYVALRRAVRDLKAGDMFAALPAVSWATRAEELMDCALIDRDPLRIAACLYMAAWVAAGRPE